VCERERERPTQEMLCHCACMQSHYADVCVVGRFTVCKTFGFFLDLQDFKLSLDLDMPKADKYSWQDLQATLAALKSWYCHLCRKREREKYIVIHCAIVLMQNMLAMYMFFSRHLRTCPIAHISEAKVLGGNFISISLTRAKKCNFFGGFNCS
jgi:hypothetical protein